MPEEKKHILFLSSWYPTKKQPFVGNFVKRQAELLVKKYDVTVLHTFSEEVSKIKISIKKNQLTEIFVEHPKGTNPLTKWQQQKKAFLAGSEKVEQKVDLIFSEIILPKGKQFYLAKKHFNCPWIHLESGSYIRRNWSFSERILARYASKYCNKIIVPSKFIQQRVEKKLNRQVEVVGYHHIAPVFQYKKKTPSKITKFLHISTLDEATKNPKGIFDAFKIALQQKTQLHLQIVSDEPTEKWEKYCEKIEISNNVSFEGAKNWEELPQFYHDADAFILNSEYETFSIVLAEAWATGTPTLTTSVGIGNKINPMLGMNHTPNSPKSLAENILKFTELKSQFNEKEISCFAQQFSEENVLSQFVQLIDSTIE